jgi:hypothetical protein
MDELFENIPALLGRVDAFLGYVAAGASIRTAGLNQQAAGNLLARRACAVIGVGVHGISCE